MFMLKNKGFLPNQSKTWTQDVSIPSRSKLRGIQKPCVFYARSEMKTYFHSTRSLENKKQFRKNKIIDLFYSNKALFLILIGSFFVCLAYSFYFQITPVVDARAYDNIAQNIVNGNGYREHLTGELSNDYAIARVGPLYEYFLAGFYKILGHRYGPVWLAQALLHALTAWLVYLTVLTIFVDNEKKKKMGLWAAAIIGFYPDLIEISAMLMTETLYLFFTCLMFYLFFSLFLSAGQLVGNIFRFSRGAGGLGSAAGAVFDASNLFFLFKPEEVLAAGFVLFGFIFSLYALDRQKLPNLRSANAFWRGRQF